MCHIEQYLCLRPDSPYRQSCPLQQCLDGPKRHEHVGSLLTGQNQVAGLLQPHLQTCMNELRQFDGGEFGDTVGR